MGRLFARHGTGAPMKWPWDRRHKEEELREELQFHLDEDAEEGVRPRLGNIALVKEDVREAWGWTFLDRIIQDLRYATRTLAGNKTFSALAILSLALGIGANTAIFSFMDSILVRSLPVPDPGSLVTLSWHTDRRAFHGTNRHDSDFDDPNGGYVGGFFAYPAFELFRKNDHVFESVFGYQGTGNLNLTFRGQADVVDGEYVSGNYFSGLGVPPAAGRLVAPDDDRAGAPAVTAISYALSRKRFGDPEQAVGQTVLVNNTPFTVVGVAPREFFGADPDTVPDIYVPMHANLLLESRESAQLYVDSGYDWVIPMARLRPGSTAKQAQAALSGQFTQWEIGRKTGQTLNQLPTLVVREGGGGLDGLKRRYSKPLYVLFTLVGLILLLACANIANLLLARAAARRREIAVRLSMGAGRLRVIRQLLTESAMLALPGGVLGVAVAFAGMRSLTLLLADGRENFTLHADLNGHVLAVTAALSLVTGVFFGLAPALQATRVDLVPALKAARIGGPVSGRMSLSRLLVVSQIAIAMLILVAAGLFVRTLSNLESIQVGFNRDRVLTFHLNARQAGHRDPEIIGFYNHLRNRFAAIPGVQAATLSDMQLIGEGTSATGIAGEGGATQGSRIMNVGPGFFSAMQIPILAGREIDERDRPGSPLIAVVNQEFRRANMQGRNPLGRHVVLPHICKTCEIEVVGVARNALYGEITASIYPIVYLAFTQSLWEPVGQTVFELRTAGDPASYVRAVRKIVHQADPRLPVTEIKSEVAAIDETIGQEITFARLCTAFAILALIIACVGLYGTMSYNVARRTSEIGIRMALGAQKGRVVWMVLREVIILAAIGLAIGIPTALAAGKLIESFLYGMKPHDPAALTIAVATLLIAAILAGYLPARNASRIDPMTALRNE